MLVEKCDDLLVKYVLGVPQRRMTVFVFGVDIGTIMDQELRDTASSRFRPPRDTADTLLGN